MASTLYSEETQKLVTWLKAMREEKGLTMRDVAGRLGVPHSFVGKMEQAERRLDVVEYVHYCKALGVSPIEGIHLIETSHPAKTPAKKKKATK